MSDLISRQAAIDAVSEACFELRGVFGRCEDALKALPSAQPEIIRCHKCKHFELNHWEDVNGIPLIVAHGFCTKWGDGCKTSMDGYCFMAERKEE